MSEIIETTASATDVTDERLDKLSGEIITLTRQAQKVALVYICEIGERLAEAKELVGHGNWGAWLRERCDYSQSTAENYIKIFKEFGKKQISFSDADSSQLENLSYTKLLALTALSEDERAKIADENDLESMSLRELQEAIEREKQARENAETEAEKLKSKLNDQAEKVKKNKDKIKELQEKRSASEQQQSILEAAADKIRENTRAELQQQIDAAVAAQKMAEKALHETEEKLRSLEAAQSDKIAAAKAEAEQDIERRVEEIASERSSELSAELEKTKTKLAAAQSGLIHKAQFALDMTMDHITTLGELLKEIEKENPESAKKLATVIAQQLKSKVEQLG